MALTPQRRRAAHKGMKWEEAMKGNTLFLRVQAIINVMNPRERLLQNASGLTLRACSRQQVIELNSVEPQFSKHCSKRLRCSLRDPPVAARRGFEAMA